MNKTRQERIESANKFIAIIASTGRRFFQYKGFVSTLELSPSNRVYFIDYYSKKRIYTHRKDCRWDGFTSGGTMQMIIERLRDFVMRGDIMNAEYFSMSSPFRTNHPWGYGEDILKVRAAAVELGIAR